MSNRFEGRLSQLITAAVTCNNRDDASLIIKEAFVLGAVSDVAEAVEEESN